MLLLQLVFSACCPNENVKIIMRRRVHRNKSKSHEKTKWPTMENCNEFMYEYAYVVRVYICVCVCDSHSTKEEVLNCVFCISIKTTQEENM